MVKTFTLDSSVIISSLRTNEEQHSEAFRLVQEIIFTNWIAVMPISVLVEVVGGIRRRAGSTSEARKVQKELLAAENFVFVPITDMRALAAADIAAEISVRGMDALVIQIANEFDAELVTFDAEMKRRASKILLRK